MSGDTDVSGFIETTRTEASVRAAPPTIYDVARVAGVATSTVSRALSNPGRVSFKTAEHVRKVAEEIGYRSTALERALPNQRTMLLAMIVTDINNPVFHGMIRGAERTPNACRLHHPCWSKPKSQNTREKQGTQSSAASGRRCDS